MHIESLRKRFCKDCGYKVSIYTDDYFFTQLSKIDGAIEKYDEFEEMIFRYKTAENFLDYYDSVINKAIESIRTSNGFKKFNSMKMDKFAIPNINTSKTIYINDNMGDYFISIDMKKANFSALQYFSKDIFNNKNTWEDFLRQFTKEEYIINSKNIRQVIMGKLSPNRQETYEKFLMNKLWENLQNIFNENQLKAFNKDELVIYLNNKNEYNEKKEQLEKILTDFSIPTEIQIFKLKGIINENQKIQGFLKEFLDESYEFKAIDSFMLNIAKKVYTNEEIVDDDLIFETPFGHAKLMEVPKLKIVDKIEKEEKIPNEECYLEF